MPIESCKWRLVDTLPPTGEQGWYAHYDHVEVPAAGWTACDIRGVIHSHQKEWVEAFDAWHAQLCQQAVEITRWWWFIAASRPNLWIPPGVMKPLFFAAGVAQWCREHPECQILSLLGCPPEVAWHLQEFSGEDRSVGPAALLARRLHALGRAWRELRGRFLRYAVSYSFRRPAAVRGRVLFYSHVVDERALREDGDHFFGDMLNQMEAAASGAVVLTYFLHEDAERSEAERILRASQRRFTFLLDHLTLGDAWWVLATGWRTSLALCRLARTAPPIRLGQWTSQLFGALYVTDHAVGRPGGVELGIYRAMRRLLTGCPFQSLIYPYEEKGLERAILQARTDAGSPVRTFAYAHAAHTTCHIAMRARPEGSVMPPQADVYLTTGPRARKFLIHWALKRPNAVVAVGSPRYLQHEVPDETELGERPLRILVLTGHGVELSMLANFLQRRRNLFTGSDVVIRRYRFGWVEAQDEALARLSSLSNHLCVGEEPLREQIRWCDVALFSSTTAGLQAMLGGRLVIYVGLHDIFEADPLLGQKVCFARCATADQLADALERARRLSAHERAGIIETQRTFAASILAPLDQDRLLNEVLGAAEPLQQRPEPSAVAAS